VLKFPVMPPTDPMLTIEPAARVLDQRSAGLDTAHGARQAQGANWSTCIRHPNR